MIYEKSDGSLIDKKVKIESGKIDLVINEYLQKVAQAKENVIKACIQYNQISKQINHEIENIEIYNKDSFTSEVIHLEGWQNKVGLVPMDEILYDLYSYNNPKNEAIYIKAIATYGEIHQLLKCVEEMAELQKEIIKRINNSEYINVDNNQLIDELVDVLITSEQIKRLVINQPNGEFRLKNLLIYKMRRLEERLNELQSL